MNRLDELNRILRKLQIDFPGIETSALISEDGLMIARAENMNMEETRVAGMAATLLNLGTRAAMELSRGAVQEVIVRGENGYAVVLSAGRGTLLLAVTNEASQTRPDLLRHARSDPGAAESPLGSFTKPAPIRCTAVRSCSWRIQSYSTTAHTVTSCLRTPAVPVSRCRRTSTSSCTMVRPCCSIRAGTRSIPRF